MPRVLPGKSALDLRIHSHEFISKLINAFRKNPCLWNIKDPEYRNKSCRFKGYYRVLEVVKQVEPKTTVNDVRRKIQSIRASHRKERKKVSESMKNAQSPYEVYMPKLWYYNDLEFLNDQMEDTFEKNNADDISENNSSCDYLSDTPSVTVIDGLEIKENVSDDENNENIEHMDSDNYENTDNKSILSNLSLASTDSMRDILDSPPPSTSKRFRTNSPEKTANQPSEQASGNNEPIKEILSYIAQKIDNNRDECDIFGKNVASELRKMTDQQRIIAKKLMNDVIFHGQLEHLTVDTQIQINNFFPELKIVP